MPETTPPGVWRVRGEPLAPATGAGPLSGVRVAVKDLFAVTGFAIGAGNPTWLAAALPSAEDSAPVAALRAAGATVTGLAHTEEFAFGLSGTNVHYGTPPNPAAPDLVPGGSSSGPAVAVALGEADLGLGTDTAGSIRVPASCCGLFGLRTTTGSVCGTGTLDLARSFDTVGWLARDPAVLRAAGRVLLPAGGGTAPATVLYLDVLDGAPARVRSTARTLATSWEADFEPVNPVWAARLTELLHAFRMVQAHEAWSARGAWIEAHPRSLGLDVEARFRYGATVTDTALSDARAELAGWRDNLRELLDGDAWLALPAAAGPGHPRTATAPVRDHWRQATLRCTIPASVAGLPSLTVPTEGDGPPVGVSFIAPAGADHALLDALT